MTIDQWDSERYFTPIPTRYMSIIFFLREFMIWLKSIQVKQVEHERSTCSRIFDRLKHLTGHFVNTEPFNSFALFTWNFEPLDLWTEPLNARTFNRSKICPGAACEQIAASVGKRDSRAATTLKCTKKYAANAELFFLFNPLLGWLSPSLVRFKRWAFFSRKVRPFTWKR